MEKLSSLGLHMWNCGLLVKVGQGHHDHLEQDGSNVPREKVERWKQVDF